MKTTPRQFELKDTLFIPLCDLLKVTGLCQNGGEAKHVIELGQVRVDGEVELRKRAKILKGQIIDYHQTQIKVI